MRSSTSSRETDTTPIADRPKLLGHADARDARVRQLALPHMTPLVAFVERIRLERRLGREVPHFDPWDGGVTAEILYVLEAPGPKTIASGFVSRNNPDESARNFHRANSEAEIPRARTVSWNVVPWTLSDARGRVRAPRQSDIAAGLPYLERLIGLLPRLRTVVLLGRNAERATPLLAERHTGLAVFVAPHPSPQFVNRRPENRARLTDALREVARQMRFDPRAAASKASP